MSDGVDGEQHDDADDNAQHNANEYRHNDTCNKCDKYQLSLIDPRDKIVLYTELDDLPDKLQWSRVGVRRYYQLS